MRCSIQLPTMQTSFISKGARLTATLLATLIVQQLSARSTATTPVSTTPAKPDETVVLSVFEVRPEEDSGYQAMNTTSGSRLATPLKDTAASISPFTAEFLSDIAATNVN